MSKGPHLWLLFKRDNVPHMPISKLWSLKPFVQIARFVHISFTYNIIIIWKWKNRRELWAHHFI